MTYLERVRDRLPEGLFFGVAHLVLMETNFLTTWSLDHFLSLSPGWVVFKVVFLAVFWAFGMAWVMPKLTPKSSSAP